MENVGFRPQRVALEFHLDVVEKTPLLGSGESFQLLFAAANIKEVVPVFDMTLYKVFEQAIGFTRTTDA